jgi:hypothetical protein
VGRFNLLDADQNDLLDLWDLSRSEYDAANALILTGDRCQGRSVALHLFRGWHALATMFARRSGLPEPVLESFTIDRESKLLTSLSPRSLSSWESSFASIRGAALEDSWLTVLPEPDERYLARQARMLGRCLKAHRPRGARIPWRGGPQRVGWRNVSLTIAVLVLVVAAFDLGMRFWLSRQTAAVTEDASPTIPHDVHLILEQLSEEKSRGQDWNGPGTVKFTNRAVVSLGGVAHSETLSISLDGNDCYRIGWRSGDENAGEVIIEPTRNQGLEVYHLRTPEEAVSLGFDSIVIEIEWGDGDYSLGQLVLDQAADGSPTSQE